jgi:hypothetical protein
MRQFFTRRKRDVSGMIVAVVVGDDAALEMFRASERANPDATIRTFHSCDDAARWLTLR